jgi:hypothetical protein
MERARFDWLVELGGASALGLAAGFAALKAAPSFAWPGPAAMTAGGFACFGLGLAAMRAVRPPPPQLELEEFVVEPIQVGELLLEDIAEEPLLLDEIYDGGALLLDDFYVDGALLLDDPLVEPDPAARVVQLFAAPPMPTPGQLMKRIDRHLAGAPRRAPADLSPPQPDATDALYRALNELKRSLN